MRSIVFVLGREPRLSVAEIATVLNPRGTSQFPAAHPSLGQGRSRINVAREQAKPHRPRGPTDAGPSSSLTRFAWDFVSFEPEWERAELGNEALVVPIASFFPSRWKGESEWGWGPALMDRLGGTVKIGEAIDEMAGELREGAESIGKIILERTKNNSRVNFGFSVYDLGGGPKSVAHMRRELSRIAPEIKRRLRSMGRSARWVTSREPILSSVVVAKNNLLPNQDGAELLVLVASDRIIIAQTLAVQPFEEWGCRDYGRPRRDARSGMLPPKLARIMLNLARVPIGGTVLDPFCGSGTVLTEAMRFGIARIIGTDVSAKAIVDARRNTDWLRGHLSATAAVAIKQCDVKKLHTRVRPETVDAIVTEPYLGPSVVSGQWSAVNAPIRELRALYVAAFREFKKALRSGGRVVFITPVFRIGAREQGVAITSEVEELGFRRVNPFPAPLIGHSALGGAPDLLYARPDQRVGRHILIFKKT